MLELSVPIVGFGLALATFRDVAWPWLLLSLAVSLAVGYLVTPALPNGLALAAMFIAVGIPLISPNSWLPFLILPMAVAVGGFVGYGLKYSVTGDLQGNVAPVSLTIVVVFSIVLARRHYRDWYAIPRRIGGSWLLAAGTMLLAVFLRSPDTPVMATGAVIPSYHDPNQPHIHGANGEIIYLPTGRGEQEVTPPRKKGVLPGLIDNQKAP